MATKAFKKLPARAKRAAFANMDKRKTFSDALKGKRKGRYKGHKGGSEGITVGRYMALSKGKSVGNYTGFSIKIGGKKYKTAGSILG